LRNSNDRVRVRVRVRVMNDRDPNVDCCQQERDCVDELKNIEIYIIYQINYRLMPNSNIEELSNSCIIVVFWL